MIFTIIAITGKLTFLKLLVKHLYRDCTGQKGLVSYKYVSNPLGYKLKAITCTSVNQILNVYNILRTVMS